MNGELSTKVFVTALTQMRAKAGTLRANCEFATAHGAVIRIGVNDTAPTVVPRLVVCVTRLCNCERHRTAPTAC
jgi:hypothetical protein